MKKLLPQICLLLLLGFALRVDATEDWSANLPEALADAKQTNRPVLVYFIAPWCGPCRVMKQTTLSDPKVKERTGSFLKVMLDFDTNPDAVKQFKIEGIPAFVVLSSSGEPISKSVGYMDAVRFERWLTDGLALAAFADAKQKAFSEKVAQLEQSFQSAEKSERARAILQLFELCASSEQAAREYAVKKIEGLSQTDPGALLTGLNHEKLAVRIEVSRLLQKQFGADFQFDPWLSRTERMKAMDELTHRLFKTE